MSAPGSSGRVGALPVSISEIIGRQAELATICNLLRSKSVRLLTLTGSGGVGKTRLALESANMLSTLYPDGVVYVSLAPITDPDVVGLSVARTFGVRESRDERLIDSLIDVIGDREILLVLDNFEQVLAAGLLVADLLAGCAHLRVLVTSRSRLRIRGEHEFVVAPLDVPDLAHSPIDTLESFDSIALFIERTREIRPGFELTNVNGAFVAGICARVDGLPLAIELAASRMKVLDSQELFERLDMRLPLLTGGSRDLPERQRTLREAIAWSYDLLDARQQTLFRRLAIFNGGFTVESAVAIMPEDDETAIVDTLSALVDQSLVGRSGGDTRFSLLETIREYAMEQLAAVGELALTQSRHAAFFVGVAEDAAPELHGPQQLDWLTRLEVELENIRAALLWLLDWQANAAMQMAGALGWYWYMRGHLVEGMQWLKQALERASADQNAYRARAHTAIGMLLRTLAEFPLAEGHLNRAVAICRQTGDIEGLIQALDDLAFLLAFEGKLDEVRALMEEGLELAIQIDDRNGQANHLSGLSLVELHVSGNPERSAQIAQQSLALFREVGDLRNIAMELAHLGYGSLQAGDYDMVPTYLEEGLALAQQLGDHSLVAIMLKMRGFLAVHSQDPVLAHEYFSECVDLYRKLRMQGDIVDCLEGMAGISALTGEFERAVRLFGAAETWRQRLDQPIQLAEKAWHERVVDDVRRRLDPDSFSQLYADGASLSLEDAVALGLAQLPKSSPVRIQSPFGLTMREFDVLALAAQGLTDPEIAVRLFIARRTVNTHLTSIYTKLNVNSRTAATRVAVERGLV